MLKRTEGIVIKCVKFRETSIIAHVFTPGDGIVALLVSGVRSKNNKGKAAQFQIGQILDVVFYDKQKEGVMRLKESTTSVNYRAVPFSITRIAFMQYLVEVTRNSTYQTAVFSDSVYPLLRSMLTFLDETSQVSANLAAYYVWRLIDKLGLAPNLDVPPGMQLDLHTNELSRQGVSEHMTISEEMAGKMTALIEAAPVHLNDLNLSGRERKWLIEAGHRYLRVHLPYFKVPQSAEIYREILKL